MKSLLLSFAIASLAACGPSAKQVKAAKSASYSCSFQEVFTAVTKQLKTQTAIEFADTEQRAVVGAFRWHTRNGVPHKRGAAAVGDGDVQMSIAVLVKGTEAAYRLEAAPRVLAHIVGGSAGQELKRSDGDWPDWVDEKVDVLLVDIHKRLKHCTNAPE